jgi:predicted dehydrogenase
VGTGGIAELAHLPALRALGDRVELVAAVDTDRGKLADFTVRHAIPAARSSVAELLERDRPDLVHLCTPPAAHASDAVRCLTAGAWVLIEKPPTRSLAEYDEIAAAERPGGPYASVVFQHRFGSAGLRLARLARTGTLGRPLVAQCVTAWYRGHDYYDVPWRGRWETEGGGPTMSHGIHQMDLLLAVLGDWSEVRAMAATLGRRVQTEDVSAAVLRFASGAVATVLNSVLSPREESYLRFDFTDASVELRHLYGYRDENWALTPAPHAAGDRRLLEAWHPDEPDVPSSHTAQLVHLLDAWEHGARPPLSGAEGRETLELITAIYRSAFTGSPVRRADLGPHDPFYHRLDGGDGGDGRLTPAAAAPTSTTESAKATR